ncbi:hypothetical protein ACGFT2_00850 [Streptomyces sp. NPDC048514]|uniref:hypothetical protein n=1 Tax=Streptomyces sp. NPDC048514 TaxID=3365564 RepID=UPI00371183AD
MGGALATYTYINPLLTDRAGIPASAVPLVLVAFGAGALGGPALAGQALASSLGVAGPALVGALFAALTLPPPTALAVSAQRGTTRVVAQGTFGTGAPAPQDRAEATSLRS